MASKVAVQLYTVRDFLKTGKDLAASLEKIGAMGYPAVQLSAVGAMEGSSPEVSAAEAKKMLDANGLKCIATHRDWASMVNTPEKEIEFHRTLDCDYVAIGGIPGEYGKRGAEGYAQFVRDSVPVLTKLKEAGLRWGYHNHAYEFQRIGEGRRTFYDIFIDEGNADFTLEIDVYWADHAGVNPVRLFERSKGRVPVIHLKDKEMIGNDPVMAPIGEGNLDWEGIIPACEAAGVEWYCVEQDTCRRDPFDCLKSSFKFLTSQGL